MNAAPRLYPEPPPACPTRRSSDIHDEIVRSQALSLTDLLRGRAGIDIGNQGGHGKLSNVFMRGAEADQVLVLIDGVRVGSVSAGLTAFQDLPVDQIDRIEIVRGPRSSLYGSEIGRAHV